MRTVLQDLITKKYIYFLLSSILLVGFYFIFSLGKETLHITLNQFHTPFWDIFFKYATYLGDGIIFPIVIVGLLIFKRKYATAFIIAGLLTLILSYVFKNWVFTNAPRPYEVFGDTLHLISGEKMRKWHSFPSGHTTTAFALFMLTIHYAKKINWQLLLLLLALIAAWSRVYLSQHFVEDIIAGALLGTSIAFLSFRVATRYPFFKK